jgi:single-strand DNA-binding protein
MNTMKNKVQIIGHVGAAPEIKKFENGTVIANISVATNESYTNDKGEKVENTLWHRITAFGKTAQLVETYVGKGKEIAIEGKLSYRNYDDKNGEKRYVTEIIAQEILFLGKSN